MLLEKILQSQGFGSRKQVRLLIEQGLVEIEGQVCANPKQNFATDGLAFTVQGKPWLYREHVYIALNKPAGYECSHTPQHHKSVFSLFPDVLLARGLQAVGRLDQDTTGLLLLTDNGKYLHALTHPRKHVAKRYRVTTSDPIKPTEIKQLLAGVELMGESQLIKADTCVQHDTNSLSLTIHQGIYHQVKRMIAAVGNDVVALHREQIGAYTLPADLAEGEWVYLDDASSLLATQSGTVT